MNDSALHSDAVQQLGSEIWTWRLETSFRTSDDIPRVDHAPTWTPEISLASIDERRARATGFADRWAELDVAAQPVAVQIDHRLLGSALARVTWELDMTRNWERDAGFLVGQALGPWFDLLLQPPPFSNDRQNGLLHVLSRIPDQLEIARSHLARAGVAPLARATVEELAGIEEAVAASVEGLRGFIDDVRIDTLAGAGRDAGQALGSFRDWLSGAAEDMSDATAIGREDFIWFLTHVQLLPRVPEDLVVAARHEFDRAVVAEAIEVNRNRERPVQPLPVDAAAQVADHDRRELAVRAHYDGEGILSQPDSIRRYLTAPMPPYLAPLQFLGVTDDLTGDARLDMNGVSYTPEPSDGMPYFYAANARDPRLGIIHEGAHYQQLAIAWAHPDPIRRRYYDSVPNEGIAFYNEEMLLQTGLFDDEPRSREVVHNFNRLRSLRVIVDVNLATGTYTMEEGIQAFVDMVPMDRLTASEETAHYAANPGHAMTYLVGKLEIIAMQSQAIRTQGSDFSLRDFHDYVWLNGNLPFSLQRWELLGDRSDIDALDQMGAWHN